MNHSRSEPGAAPRAAGVVSDPFATLGLAQRYDLNERELERRYRDLQQALHPDKYTSAPASERRMTLRKAVEVNEAYRVLRDDVRRAEALLALLAPQPMAAGEAAAPEFLLEMLELREQLAEASAARDATQVTRLATQVAQRERAIRGELAGVFARLAELRSPDALAAVRGLVSRLRYYRRFLDEVASFEDATLSEEHPG